MRYELYLFVKINRRNLKKICMKIPVRYIVNNTFIEADLLKT